MTKQSALQCGDCETLLESAEEAERHAKLTCHTNFRVSDEPILHLVCTVCRHVCRCKTEFDLHTKRTGHSKFQDKTAEVEQEEARRILAEYCRKIQELLGENRRQPSLPLQDPAPLKPFMPILEDKSSLLSPTTKAKAEQMRNCLRTLKQSHKDDEAKVKASFDTLNTYAKNVWTNPDEEKYRKIRLSNAAFQERIGKGQGGIEFLEICGFERIEGGEFLHLPREKVDMEVFEAAGYELNNAISNPYFGLI